MTTVRTFGGKRTEGQKAPSRWSAEFESDARCNVFAPTPEAPARLAERPALIPPAGDAARWSAGCASDVDVFAPTPPSGKALSTQLSTHAPAPMPPSQPPAGEDDAQTALRRVRERLNKLAANKENARTSMSPSPKALAQAPSRAPAAMDKVRFWGADELAQVEQKQQPLASQPCAATTSPRAARPLNPLAGLGAVAPPPPCAALPSARNWQLGMPPPPPPPTIRPLGSSLLGSSSLVGSLSAVGALASPSLWLKQRRLVEASAESAAAAELGAPVDELPRRAVAAERTFALAARPTGACGGGGGGGDCGCGPQVSGSALAELAQALAKPTFARTLAPVPTVRGSEQDGGAAGPATSPPLAGGATPPARAAQPSSELAPCQHGLRSEQQLGASAADVATGTPASAAGRHAERSGLRDEAMRRLELGAPPHVSPRRSPFGSAERAPLMARPASSASRSEAGLTSPAAFLSALDRASAGRAAAASVADGARASPARAAATSKRADGATATGSAGVLAPAACGVPPAVLWLVLSRLDGCDLDYPCGAVCAGWRSAARAVLSLGTLIGCTDAHEVVLADEAAFYAAFPRAAKIAEGGWKRVYRAERAGGGGGERGVADALAVIDVEEATRLGVRAQLELEMSVMHFCSLLVSERACPHFVLLHATFLVGFPLPADGWARTAEVERARDHARTLSAERALEERTANAPAEPPAPSARRSTRAETASAADENDEPADDGGAGGRGRKQTRPRRRAAEPSPEPALAAVLQVVHMELCDGDLEALTAGKALPLADVLAYACQMCVAVCVAQRALGLVHHDLKLLNFFARRPRGAAAAERAGQAAVRLVYVLPPEEADAGERGGGGERGGEGGGVRLALELDTARPTLCLLSDFGTAEVGEAGGGAAGLPICAHHFTTYENTPADYLLLGGRATQSAAADAWTLGLALLHLATGHAPYEELLAALRCPPSLRAALNDAWSSGRDYAVVRKALARDDDGVLADTLYRYWVMLGAPAHDGGWLEASRAHEALVSWSGAHAAELARDACAYGLDAGVAFGEARARMAAAPGLGELVRGLLCWQPARRLSPERALRNAPVFAPMRAAAAAASTASTSVFHL